MTKKTFDKIRTLPTKPGEIISADLIGPVTPITSPHGYRFALTIIDGFTKFATIFLLKRKNETLKYLKIFFQQAQVHLQERGHFKIFRSDNGKEFVNTGVQNLLMQYGIQHQVSEPYTSQHNASAERFNRTIEQKTRSLLSDSGFPTAFWGLAISAAEFIYNRTPHSAVNYEQPIALWSGKSSQTSSLALFGAATYHLQPNKPPGKKFSEVSNVMFLVGYSETGYILYDPMTKKTIESCNVKFDETRVYKDCYPIKPESLTWETPNEESQTGPQQSQETQPEPRVQQTTEVQMHMPPSPALHQDSQQSQTTSYRSLDLSDCSLPVLEANLPNLRTDEQERTGSRTGAALSREREQDGSRYQAHNSPPVSIEDAPDDGIDWDQCAQKRRTTQWEH